MFPTLSFGDQEITPPDLAIGSAKAADVLASIGSKDARAPNRQSTAAPTARIICLSHCSLVMVSVSIEVAIPTRLLRARNDCKGRLFRQHRPRLDSTAQNFTMDQEL